jgi:hypothetical protein
MAKSDLPLESPEQSSKRVLSRTQQSWLKSFEMPFLQQHAVPEVTQLSEPSKQSELKSILS